MWYIPRHNSPYFQKHAMHTTCDYKKRFDAVEGAPVTRVAS